MPRPYNQRFLTFIENIAFKRNLVIITAVNKLIIIPRPNVIAKPLIVPVPKIKRTTAAIAVVI